MSIDQVYLALIVLALNIIIAAIQWFMKDRLRLIEKENDLIKADMKNLVKDMQEMRANYLNRFDKIHVDLHDTRHSIMNAIHSMHLLIEKLK